MRYLLFFVCFFSLNLSNAQKQYTKFTYEKKDCTCHFDSINVKFDSISLNINDISYINDASVLACGYHCVGVHYTIDWKDWEAIKAYEAAIEIRKKNKGKGLQKSYKNAGICYKHVEYYSKSLNYLERIDDSNRDSDIHRYVAESYEGLGDYEKALIAANKSIKTAKNSLERGDAHNAYCRVLLETKDALNLLNAVKYADEAIRYFNDINNTKRIARSLNNKGNAYKSLSKYPKAIQTYEKAFKMHMENKDTLEAARTLNNIATALMGKGEYNSAINTLQKSLEIKKKHYNNSEPQYTYAANYENLGEIYSRMENYDEALRHFQLAISNLKDNPKSEAPYIYNKPDLLRVLDLKAQATIKDGNIDLASSTYQVLDEWITEFYKDLSTNESKLTWIARAHAMYANAIEVALKKGKKEKAFEYTEKAHAVLLWQSLSQQAARSFISKDSDKEKIDDLTAQIRQADQQYRNGEIQIDSLRSFDDKQKQLEQKLEQDYPEYKDRKYQPEATTVSDIQSEIIDDHTAFIEYYHTDEVLYIFTITKDSLEVTQKHAEGLADDIFDFVKNISNKDSIKIENYHALAHKLYQKLIPQSIQSNDKINRLVIVPDREIGTLPFAALATQATSGELDKNTPFLVKKYTTNYLYSAGSYLQLQNKSANQKYCFAGIAPIEYKIKGREERELIHAGKELDEIKSLHWMWRREILKEEAATKAGFEKIIKDGYKTILVSTHAAYGEDGGEIVFRDSVLTQDRIDLLEIKTHRLILSACETGVGKQNQGEGILSLGWNFAYKGVPSITMTHWKVHEFTTKEIIVSYSEKLNRNMSADQALKEAQLEYLNNYDGKHITPFYWAALFHTGNTN